MNQVIISGALLILLHPPGQKGRKGLRHAEISARADRHLLPAARVVVRAPEPSGGIDEIDAGGGPGRSN